MSKKEEVKTVVKTVYGPTSVREPDFTTYDSKEEAEFMIGTTLKWGIDIVSCEIVSSEEIK